MNPRLVGALVALGVIVVDQIVKLGILARSAELPSDSIPLAPFLDLTLRWNRGISFSLFAGDSQSGRLALLGLTCAAVAFLVWWLLRSRSSLPATALGLIVGGAIGNAIDRLLHGAVVDYLDLHAFGRHFFVFNIADAAINVGVALLIVDVWIASRAPGELKRASHDVR